MSDKKITNSERSCISRCIVSNYGEYNEHANDYDRERSYQACLRNCNICG